MLMKIQLFSMLYLLIVAFIYVCGSTPAQLAIGQNPKLLSTFHDSLPTLEGCINSSIIKHLFMEKLVQKPARQFCDVVFKPKGNVFCKLTTDRQWQGPATVI